jgi:photosynthetic reaction center cytochrome c subunit
MNPRALTLVAVLGAGALLAACERPPMHSTQSGYRGTGMVQIENPRIVAAQKAALPPVPESPPPAPVIDGPKAKEIYKNVQVLGDLSVIEFTRQMLAITQWVAPPEQGCNYCHNVENLADDGKYTKLVARRMLEMTRHVNADWKQHIGQTGVTCYTCHRGKPVPEYTWFTAAKPKNNRVGSGMGDDAGQNKAVPSIALASLPYDPFTGYLLGDDPIRVEGPTPLPAGNRQSIKQAEFTYSLMNHISKSLGVNCTFCHNTHSFQSWDGPPQRVTAWYGIRMARELNNTYMVPLTKTFPASRLGPTGDVAKVACFTCHQGVNKPLGGLQMAKDFPGLIPVVAMVAAMPPPVAEPTHAVMYFGVGSPVLEGEQAKGMAQLIATLTAQKKTTATISGYHSAAGTLEQNQELAKQRAFTVRDALLAAGVAESRVKLDRPRETEANVAGEDPTARRVEVTVR